MAPVNPLKALQEAFGLIENPMYCGGAVPLHPDSSTIFYRAQDASCHIVDFANADDTQLAALSSACDPASFGRDSEDVLDEAYRKALKMDSSKFSAQFSIHSSGILDSIVSSLVKDQQAKGIRAELYKLNVYGPGSFFKPHVDTPRSDAMFGSLVLVFPTKHEGGTLRFRHGDQQWSFESSDLIASEDPTERRVAFAAFFSDVEHEVLPVTSGYRVTLTYNLYWSPTEQEETVAPSSTHQPFLEQAQSLLKRTLDNPKYMPDGGFVGFGLTHLYPINPKSTKLAQIRLKGGDSIIQRLCEDMGLKTSLRAIYRGFAISMWSDREDRRVERRVMMDEIVQFGGGEYDLEDCEDGYVGYLYTWESGVKVLDTNEALKSHLEGLEWERKTRTEKRAARVDWIRPLPRVNSFQSSFIAYGNEARAATAYGEVCLVAEVACAADRLASAQKSKESDGFPEATVVNTSERAESAPTVEGGNSGAEPTSVEPVAKPKSGARKSKRGAAPAQPTRKSPRTAAAPQ